MVIKETTKVLDEETMGMLVQQEDTTYYFGPEATAVGELKSGDVMVSTSGQGLLRKVTAVSIGPDGLIVVETAQATLEDLIETGTISFTKTLTHADIASTKALIPGVRLVKAIVPDIVDFTIPIDGLIYDQDGVQVRAGGSITFNVDLDFAVSLGIFPPGVSEFKNVFIVKNTQSLTIEVGGSIPIIGKKIAIYEMFFNPVTIGFVIIVPKVTVNVGVDGEVEASITSTVTLDTTIIAGVHYKRDEDPPWKPVSDAYCGDSQKTFPLCFGFDIPTISAGASLKGYVAPDLALLLYGVVGPYAGLEGYLKLVADLLSDPWWSLYGGIGAFAGARAEIIGYTLADFGPINIFPENPEWLIASAPDDDIPPSSDTSAPSVPAGLTASAVSSIQINLSWTASMDDVGVAGYYIYRNGSLISSVLR